MYRLGMTEGIPIESELVSRRIENAQKSVEAQNFDARKHLLEYDDVMKNSAKPFPRFAAALEGQDQRDMFSASRKTLRASWLKPIARASSIPASGITRNFSPK